MARKLRLQRLALFLIHSLFAQLTQAQTIAVSTTAAWSSQIVAFWGAIVIAVRSSVRNEVTNAASSIFFGFRAVIRTRRINGALARGNWFLHSGWNNGHLRTHIAFVDWRTAEELLRLSRRVALQIEVFGTKWEVLVVGHQLKGSGDEPGSVHWINSPRSAEVVLSRIKENGQIMCVLPVADIADGITMMQARGKAHINDIVQELSQRRDLRATRCTLASEIPTLEDTAPGATWGSIFTRVDLDESPYLSLSRFTGQFGSERNAIMKCSSKMYAVVHFTVSCAIGLMGAASGRGLTVWLMAVRPTLATLGAQNVQGNNVIGSLLALDKSIFQYETADGSPFLAGDIISPGMTWLQFAAVFLVPLAELAIILAGWLYGDLKVHKLPPTGVVGHGMLWLSTLVGLALSIRALISLRVVFGGRLVGFWKTAYFDRITVGERSQEISVDRILRSPDYTNTVLGFIATILRDCTVEEYTVAKCVLRLPLTGHLVASYVVTEILQYAYSNDYIVSKGDPAVPVSVPYITPWVQTCCCCVATMACCCMSAIYAYAALPTWVKPLTEVVTAVSALWFTTLELTGGLPHHRGMYVCFMVATLVVSSVWYVGVKDVA